MEMKTKNNLNKLTKFNNSSNNIVGINAVNLANCICFLVYTVTKHLIQILIKRIKSIINKILI